MGPSRHASREVPSCPGHRDEGMGWGRDDADAAHGTAVVAWRRMAWRYSQAPLHEQDRHVARGAWHGKRLLASGCLSLACTHGVNTSRDLLVLGARQHDLARHEYEQHHLPKRV